MIAITAAYGDLMLGSTGFPTLAGETLMLSKEAYIQRLARHLDAPGELTFLERLSQEELAMLWSKVAGKTLRVGHHMAGARRA